MFIFADKVNDADSSEERELVAAKQIRPLKGSLLLAEAEAKQLLQFKGVTCSSDLLGIYSDNSSFWIVLPYVEAVPFKKYYKVFHTKLFMLQM